METDITVNVATKNRAILIDELYTCCFKITAGKNVLGEIDKAKEILKYLGGIYGRASIRELELLFVDAQCWRAQDVVCNSSNPVIVAKAAKIAQSLNKKRNQLLGIRKTY